ncbi:hypothetical protein D3C80_1898940 [compost metagenome]
MAYLLEVSREPSEDRLVLIRWESITGHEEGQSTLKRDFSVTNCMSQEPGSQEL